MIYDGTDLSSLLHVQAVRRPLAAEITNDVMDLTSGNGGLFTHNRLSSRIIETDVFFLAKVPGKTKRNYELEQLRRQLGIALYRSKPCKLVLDDAPDLFEMAVLDGSTDLNRLNWSSSTTLSWVCPEPASYGQYHQKTCDGGQTYVNVHGSYPTAPILTVHARGAFSVKFDDSYFPILETNGNDPVVIDSVNHLVTQGGEPLFYSIMADFPSWDAGAHSVTCEYPYTLEWHERWL